VKYKKKINKKIKIMKSFLKILILMFLMEILVAFKISEDTVEIKGAN
jgi:hypothetical protein